MHVLFEDNHCLVLNKPSGLLTQAPPGVPSLEAQAKAYLKEKYNKSGRVYLGVPHRLDRPVSGVVLFARQSKSARRLAEQFHERQVQKIYWALVEGLVQPEEGVWEDHVRKIPGEAKAQCVAADDADAKSASLRYRVLHIMEKCTLLEVQLETGRMHQIRVQASSRGHVVLGDVLYGATIDFGPVAAALPRDRHIALHGYSLSFLHPIRYDAITVVATLPNTWHKVLKGTFS